MRKLITLTSILLIFFFAGQGLCVSAFEYTHYTTSSVPENEKADFLERINFQRLDAPAEIYPFSCFAISEQGQIALGFNIPADAQIGVYNSEGEFRYGIQFENNKSHFVIFFEGEKLSIYWYKSQYIGSFDADGSLIQLRRCINSKQNIDSSYLDGNRSSNGKIGDICYHAESTGLSLNYSRFTIEDENGVKTVIYDVMQQSRKNSKIVGVVFFCIAAIIVFMGYKKKKVETDNHAASGSEEFP